MVKFKVKPTQKETWRYIGFEVISEGRPGEKDIVKATIQSILRMFGEEGASETNVWLIEYNEKKKLAILRCSNKAQTKVLGALTAVTKIDDSRTVFNTLGVSGTIKKLKQNYLN